VGNQSFDRNRVIVLSVIHGSLTATAAAARYGVTRQWVQELLRRYREHGEDGLRPRSRAPRASPTRTSDRERARILELRDQLDSQGLDHGAEAIAALNRPG
jgi:transposase